MELIAHKNVEMYFTISDKRNITLYVYKIYTWKIKNGIICEK